MSWHARSRRATALEGLSVAATAHVRDVTPSGRCARDSAQAATTSPGAGAAAVRSNEVTAPPPSVTGSDQTPPADRVTPAMSASGMPRPGRGPGLAPGHAEAPVGRGRRGDRDQRRAAGGELRVGPGGDLDRGPPRPAVAHPRRLDPQPPVRRPAPPGDDDVAAGGRGERRCRRGARRHAGERATPSSWVPTATTEDGRKDETIRPPSCQTASAVPKGRASTCRYLVSPRRGVVRRTCRCVTSPCAIVVMVTARPSTTEATRTREPSAAASVAFPVTSPETGVHVAAGRATRRAPARRGPRRRGRGEDQTDPSGRRGRHAGKRTTSGS